MLAGDTITPEARAAAVALLPKGAWATLAAKPPVNIYRHRHIFSPKGLSVIAKALIIFVFILKLILYRFVYNYYIYKDVPIMIILWAVDNIIGD